jgi:hypothetical protein
MTAQTGQENDNSTFFGRIWLHYSFKGRISAMQAPITVSPFCPGVCGGHHRVGRFPNQLPKQHVGARPVWVARRPRKICRVERGPLGRESP